MKYLTCTTLVAAIAFAPVIQTAPATRKAVPETNHYHERHAPARITHEHEKQRHMATNHHDLSVLQYRHAAPTRHGIVSRPKPQRHA